MNAQEKIIKPSSRYWSQEISAIILFLIVIPIAGIFYFGERMYFAGGLALLVGIPFLISELRTYKNQITFSKSDIVAKMGKDEFKQSWESIKAIKFVGPGQSRQLVLYCGEYNVNIPCRFFDEAELTEALREHLSPSVLHPQAYQKLPQFLEWQENITKSLSGINEPLKVSLGNSEKWFGFFGVCLGMLFAGLNYFSVIDSAAAIMMGVLFGGLGLIILFSCFGWIEGNNETISMRTLFRNYSFSWNELREIYISSSGVVALVGNDSRLILRSSSSWSGKDKELLFELINLKIEMSKIEPIESSKPLYWQSKNA